MPIPAGSVPILGPLLDTTGALLPASAALRDAGVLSLRSGRIQRVNQAADGWEPLPGHVIAATAPTTGLFEGLIWYDTTNNALMTFNGTAFVAVSGSVVFGSAAGQVATWAEGNSNAAFPLGKIDGAQEATQAEMRIRWSGSQAGLNATHFETGQDGRGNTRDGTLAPLAVGVNEFLGIWIGTAEANIVDIEEGGTTVLGDLFTNVAAGEPLTVDGTAGTVYRTATAVQTTLWSEHRFRATLNPLHFGDVIDARVRGDVSEVFDDVSISGHALTFTRFDDGNPATINLPEAREFGRTNAVTFTGSNTSTPNPTNVNNGRIWNYTDNGTPTVNYQTPSTAVGNWRAMIAHTGTGGTVTVQGSGTTLGSLAPGESGLAIFTTTNQWQFVFVGRNPTTVTQTVAETGTSTDVFSWTPQRVAQAIAALETGGSVTFGSGAGEVSPIAEGNNADAWPFSKLPVGVAQTEVEVRVTWDTSTSWNNPEVVVSETGTAINIPAAPVGATQLEFLVRIDTSAELRDILIDGADRSVLFPNAPVAFMLDGTLYQRYTTPVLDAATRTALSASTIEIRLTANAHDQHIEYLVEEYLTEDPVIESITLTDDAFQTLNSAGASVSLTWPSSVRNQAGGDGDGQVNAMHAVGISEHNTAALTGAVANPANAFDGNTATSVAIGAGHNVLRGQIARTVYGGRVVLDVTPATSVTFSLQFLLNNANRGTISTGGITSAGEHGFNAPLTTWNQVIITGTAFSGGDATLREVRTLDSNSALPGASTADLTAETTAREAADTALGARIDALSVDPTTTVGGDLLNVIAERVAVHTTLTLGEVAPSNLELGYTIVPSLAGTFNPAIPTGDLTNLVKVFMSRQNTTDNRPPGGTINTQFRLFLEVNEAAATRAWEGATVVWGPTGDNPTLEERTWTWGWHSQNRNTYYTDTVAHRPTAAGQMVTFNMEDVAAERFETFPGTPWIWHATIATTNEHISNDTFTTDTASQTFAPTQHAVATFVNSRPAGSVDSVRVFYMAGQTTRHAAVSGRAVLPRVGTAVENFFSRLTFNTTPNESLFSPSWTVDWRTQAEAISDQADRVGTETFPTDHFFRLPEGTYNIRLRASTALEGDRSRAALLRAQTSTDDTVEEYAIKFDSETTMNNPLADSTLGTFAFDSKYISVPSGGATFYIPVAVGNSTDRQFSGYLLIERLRS